MQQLWCVMLILALSVSYTREEEPPPQEQRATTETAEAPVLEAAEETPPETASPAVGKVAGNTIIKSFERAKKLVSQVFVGHKITFYCGCTYDDSKKKDHVDHTSCGYEPRSTSKGGKARARRREWEHVVPAENYGRSFAA